MFEWFRQLLAGRPGTPPEGVVVERDGLGRITRASATLSAGSAARPDTVHPTVEFTAGFQPQLETAGAWLCQRNIAAAQGWGIGLERDYTFDQADGRLVLKFEHGPDLALQAQVLGSFDPGDGSFMWSWHNPSIRPGLQQAAGQVREAGQRSGEAALTTPVQRIAFDRLSLLLARAAQIAGFDGVYRAITDHATSVFLAYGVAGTPARQEPVDPAFAAQALARVEGYDADLAAQDRLYHERTDRNDPTLLGRILDAKMTAWRRDWARDDDYWHPCSTAWPSDHDRTRAWLQFLAPHPGGGVLEVTVRGSTGTTAYRVEPVAGEAKITDQLVGWGRGFLWPSAAPGR